VEPVRRCASSSPNAWSIIISSSRVSRSMKSDRLPDPLCSRRWELRSAPRAGMKLVVPRPVHLALRLLGKMHIRSDQCGLRPIFDLQLFHDAPDIKFDGTFGDR
jgi:hypothetical protein